MNAINIDNQEPVELVQIQVQAPLSLEPGLELSVPAIQYCIEVFRDGKWENFWWDSIATREVAEMLILIPQLLYGFDEARVTPRIVR